ncbi:MAG: hypothetical protein U5N21_23550 [Rhodococcus sp. (in: high G+C Gram-positive bacteria)]|nr:hypothetical protein [Rhodococcus sp. (in: high G+C Gram-positive bacteria)]
MNRDNNVRVARDDAQDDMLAQLQFIGDCLGDYHYVIYEWRRRPRRRRHDGRARRGDPRRHQGRRRDGRR